MSRGYDRSNEGKRERSEGSRQGGGAKSSSAKPSSGSSSKKREGSRKTGEIDGEAVFSADYVQRKVKELVCDILGLSNSSSAYGYGYTISGPASIGLGLECAKAHHPVHVAILREWHVKRQSGKNPSKMKRAKMNSVKDLSSLRRVVINCILTRFCWVRSETMTREKSKTKSPFRLEWKLMRDISNFDNSLWFKSRETGMIIHICVAATETRLTCPDNPQSFYIPCTSRNYDAFINESRILTEIEIEIFGGDGHAKKEDHQMFREIFEQNVQNVLRPLQCFEIREAWFKKKDPFAVRSFKKIWKMIEDGIKNDSFDLESWPPWQFVAMMIGNELRKSSHTRGSSSGLTDRAIKRICKVCNMVDSHQQKRSQFQSCPVMSVSDSHKQELHRVTNEFLLELTWPSYVDKWNQRERQRQREALAKYRNENGSGQKKEVNVFQSKRLNCLITAYPSFWRGTFFLNEGFCEFESLKEVLEYRPSSSSSSSSAMRSHRIIPLVAMTGDILHGYEKEHPSLMENQPVPCKSNGNGSGSHMGRHSSHPYTPGYAGGPQQQQHSPPYHLHGDRHHHPHSHGSSQTHFHHAPPVGHHPHHPHSHHPHSHSAHPGSHPPPSMMAMHAGNAGIMPNPNAFAYSQATPTMGIGQGMASAAGIQLNPATSSMLQMGVVHGMAPLSSDGSSMFAHPPSFSGMAGSMPGMATFNAPIANAFVTPATVTTEQRHLPPSSMSSFEMQVHKALATGAATLNSIESFKSPK